MSKVLPLAREAPVMLDGLDLPIGVPEGVKLPTSFRVNAEIRAHLSTLQNSPRSRGFHPSELPKMCPMKFFIYDKAIENFASSDPAVIQKAVRTVRAILDTEHEVAPGRIPPRLDPDLHAGDSIHEYQQFRYGERGYLWGRWECPACEAMTPPGFMPRIEVLDRDGKRTKVAAPCPRCRGCNYAHKYGTVRWRYVEPWAGLTEWGIEGHTDGIMLRPVRKKKQTPFILPAVLEIKSINENGYYGRYGEPLPKEEHIKQASQYVFSARHTYPWLRDLKHIYFVYVNKNAQRDVKEFLVEADMQVVAEMQGTMQAVIDAQRTDQPPHHARLCSGVDAQDAIKCPVVEECLGEKPMANFFSNDAGWEDLPL